jgi:hypothetical protein
VPDPLREAVRRIVVGAVGLSAAAGLLLTLLGRGRDGLGLLCGAIVSALNFLATSRFLGRVRDAAGAAGGGGAGALPDPRAAYAIIMRYLALGLVLAILIVGAGLPAPATILGVAAVPLTLYLWPIGLLLTGRWRPPGRDRPGK